MKETPLWLYVLNIENWTKQPYLSRKESDMDM